MPAGRSWERVTQTTCQKRSRLMSLRRGSGPQRQVRSIIKGCFEQERVATAGTGSSCDKQINVSVPGIYDPCYKRYRFGMGTKTIMDIRSKRTSVLVIGTSTQ